ncbi:MAG: bifunctional oligoribonuclease/PAP phosphatase NrnA [Bacilli bacterium]
MEKNLIVEQTKLYKTKYKQIVKLIDKYEKIAIFRHKIPDFDALGSQLGLMEFLKEKFPTKDIKVLGENHLNFTPKLYREMDVVDDSWFETPFLAIVVDCGNKARISDQRFLKASALIKFDHHPDVEKFGDVSIVDEGLAAASELLTNFIHYINKGNVVNLKSAFYFYSGIVGDSGRFLYSSTTPHTFACAQYLIASGLDTSNLYLTMYEKDIKSLEITKYILNHYKLSKNGVAYYILGKEALEELQLDQISGKDFVNTFSNFKEIQIWCSIAEDTIDNCWRVSIRSKKAPINEVAAKWEGGGHAQASGCKIATLDLVPDFIKDLDNLLK